MRRYVVRTNFENKATLAAGNVVRACKSLSQAEGAFRFDHDRRSRDPTDSRPLVGCVRAHVLLCMLPYSLEWHMRHALAPILSDDRRCAEVAAPRSSVVALARN
jgi:hypothetical protein